MTSARRGDEAAARDQPLEGRCRKAIIPVAQKSPLKPMVRAGAIEAGDKWPGCQVIGQCDRAALFLMRPPGSG
jgi:hypothetical protein